MEINDFECNKIFIDDVIDKAEKIIKDLDPFKNLFKEEINNLSRAIRINKDNIIDLYSEERKIRIGVMGQVNVGKSSFLNVLLFNGEDILPKESTPKTVNLTKINYSSENKLVVQFYSEYEWNELKEISTKEDENFLKTLFKIANEQGLAISEYINRNEETMQFKSYEELLEKLQQYDSEHCSYSIFIKSLNIYINDDRLKNVEIIDTPGVNDPVQTRKYTIKKCLEYTDVIFFLSQCSTFLHDSDIDLIINQIPHKGIKNMILIGSKYDSLILDEGWKFESLYDTEKYIKHALKNKAQNCLGKYLENIEPIFISSTVNNLITKTKENYTKEEQHIFDELNHLWEDYRLTKEQLIDISNFEEIKRVLSKVIENKEKTFNKKEEFFISKFNIEIEKILDDIRDKAKQKLFVISKMDINVMQIEEKNTKSKLYELHENVEGIIDHIKINIENEKKYLMNELKNDLLPLLDIKVQQKTIEYKVDSYMNDSKWHKLLSRKKKNNEEESITNYNYIDVSEVVSDIYNFTKEVKIYIDKNLNNIVNPSLLKKNIIKAICNSLDEDSSEFQPNKVKALIHKSIDTVELSVVDINVDEYIKNIIIEFGEEVLNDEIEHLKSKFQEITRDMCIEIEELIKNTLEKTIFQLDMAQLSIMKYILVNTNKKLNHLKNNFYNLDSKSKDYKKVIEVIDKLK